MDTRKEILTYQFSERIKSELIITFKLLEKMAVLTGDDWSGAEKLMEELPDFCFTQSQASVYALIKKYDPGLFSRIKEKVDEGRWEAAAVPRPELPA